MILLIVPFIVSVVNGVMLPPYKYTPNGYYQGVPVTVPLEHAPLAVYPGYDVPKPVVYNKMMNAADGYYGGNQGYSNYAEDDMVKETIKDAKQLSAQGAKGVHGDHLTVKGDEGYHGYHHGAAGAKYGQSGDGSFGGAKMYGSSAKGGSGALASVGHRKGHHTSGFHKTYHNVESGKDTKFLDENHDEGEQNFGHDADSAYTDKGWDAYGKGERDEHFAEEITHDGGAKGKMIEGGSHDSRWDARDDTGLYNNGELAYRNAESHANMKGHGGLGHGQTKSGVQGMYYHGPNHYW